MTNEDRRAVSWFQMMIVLEDAKNRNAPDAIKRAFEDSVKALEQQPSEDCISREQAKKFLYEEIERLHDDGLYDCFSRIIDYMYNELPSVTSERPKEDRVEDFIKHKIDYLEDLASIETNEGRWREEEKYLYAISVLEEVVEYMNTSGGEEDGYSN